MEISVAPTRVSGDDGGMDLRTRINQGVVVGAQEGGGVAVFRGIPYAVTPVRFGAPEPAPSWGEARPAKAFGPAPPQSGVIDADDSDGNDWLTVNVWSPDLDASLPVMVWVQGGGYLFLTHHDLSEHARVGGRFTEDPPTLEWICFHVLAEYARHAGTNQRRLNSS